MQPSNTYINPDKTTCTRIGGSRRVAHLDNDIYNLLVSWKAIYQHLEQPNSPGTHMQNVSDVTQFHGQELSSAHPVQNFNIMKNKLIN